MNRRSVAVGGVFGIAAALCVVSLPGVGRPDDRPEREDSPAGRYAVVIPQARYQTIVVSPEAAGTGRSGSLRFTIRTRDKAGTVSDFPFFVRTGDIRTIEFPEGWAPTGDSIMLAMEDVNFAAWGVGISMGPNGTPAPGPMIRFEPVERDPNREARDRDRERDFEALLRAAERNR